MGRVIRRPVGTTLPAMALVLGVALLGACSDDTRSGPEAPGAGPAPDAPAHGPTSVAPATGDLDLEVPDGYFAVPLPSRGVGLVVPDGWQAVVLTDEALARVEALDVAPAFVDAARDAQGAGAVLYAAGTAAGGGVADLELARLPDVDLDDAASAAAGAAPPGSAVDHPEVADHPTARVRFRTEGAGERDEPVGVEGTRWLVEGPDAVWSLVVTSEDDPVGHDRLARALLDGLAFA